MLLKIKHQELQILLQKNDLITIENKIPNISNIASKSDLTAVENKIPDISNLVKKKQTTILKLLIL